VPHDTLRALACREQRQKETDVMDVRELGDDSMRRADRRLARVEGQVRAVRRMLDQGEDCDQVLRQIAAASKALRRVGVQLAVEGVERCVSEPSAGQDLDRFRRAFVELS
jgi:CsoR family transcriptional regulator, copper-sensing transcriptional repressor